MIPQFNPLSSFYPLSLFANGEPGFWLDPSDFSAMYQDAAGTTAVTAVEQPVGLILDKSQGLVLGAELVTTYVASGAFGNWNGMSLAGGVLTTSGAPVNGYSAQVPVTASAMYKVVLPSASVPVGGTWSYVVSWSANGVSYSGQVMTAAIGSLSFYFLAPATATKCEVTIQRTGASSGGATDTCTFNGFSVKKIAGTHYYQSTAGVRPVLSARVNLLTKTEFPSGVSDLVFKTALVTSSTLSGYAGAVAFGFDGVADAIGYKNIATAATSHTLSVVVSMDDGNAPVFGSATGSAATNTFMFVLAGNGTAPTSNTVTSLGGGLYRVSIAVTGNVSATNFGILKYHTNDSRTFKTTAWDIRPTDQFNALISQYQYVNTSTDYTTAGFPLYLSGNGTQWMQCAAQDYTGVNKMLVCAGVRKLSDAGSAMVVELSASLGANNGTFYLLTAANEYDAASKGTTANAKAATTYTAPITNVLAMTADISAPSLKLRINAVDKISDTSTQGTGNYGNYPAYLFSRAGSSLFFTGQLTQIIARGSTVASNAAQISAAESWTDLKTKAY